MTRQLAPCGTNPAYQRHKRRQEPVDEACRLAHNATVDAQRKAGSNRPRRKTAECGTPSGYGRHMRRKEDPCDPCRQVHSQGMRDWRENRKAKTEAFDDALADALAELATTTRTTTPNGAP